MNGAVTRFHQGTLTDGILIGLLLPAIEVLLSPAGPSGLVPATRAGSRLSPSLGSALDFFSWDECILLTQVSAKCAPPHAFLEESAG